MNLQETIASIQLPDQTSMNRSRTHWDSIAKPLGSLGKLERAITQIAGIQRNEDIHIEKKAIVVMCADNGIVAEGVSQSGQEVTALVAGNFLRGGSLSDLACTSILCKRAGAHLFPVDIGMAVDVPGVEKRKIAYGTKDFLKEPAMTCEEAVCAIETGIAKSMELKGAGYQMLGLGEMGIGNTTTSSAMASVFLGLQPERVTGRGAGLTRDGLDRKIEVIREALLLHRPNPDDPIDVLSKVGGFDIAGLCGVVLGAAACGMPVVLDGLISAVAALTAVRLAPACVPYLLASHVSKEPAAGLLLEALGKEAHLTCDLCLGEGSGAALFFQMLDAAADIYHRMGTFADINLEQYEYPEN